MKKILLVILIAFVFMGAFTMQSCNKCSVCSYTYTDHNGDSQSFTYAEVCGNSSDVNNYKDACANAAAAYTNGACTCVDE